MLFHKFLQIINSNFIDFCFLIIYNSKRSRTKFQRRRTLFFEILEKKQEEIKKRIKENGGSEKGIGLKSFNRWRSFWEPRIGRYEYQIKIAIANAPCFGWISSTKNFTVQ